MPDAIFADQRLAEVYDPLDPDRSDLDAYLALAGRLGARTVLDGAHVALRPRGHLAFETRDPGREAWREWDREHALARADVPGIGVVESWPEVTEVRGELVSFRTTFVCRRDGAVLTSGWTLRFRPRDDLADSLRTAGFTVEDVTGAPDRPGRELVFIARRTG